MNTLKCCINYSKQLTQHMFSKPKWQRRGSTSLKFTSSRSAASLRCTEALRFAKMTLPFEQRSTFVTLELSKWGLAEFLFTLNPRERRPCILLTAYHWLNLQIILLMSACVNPLVSWPCVWKPHRLSICAVALLLLFLDKILLQKRKIFSLLD